MQGVGTVSASVQRASDIHMGNVPRYYKFYARVPELLAKVEKGAVYCLAPLRLRLTRLTRLCQEPSICRREWPSRHH